MSVLIFFSKSLISLRWVTYHVNLDLCYNVGNFSAVEKEKGKVNQHDVGNEKTNTTVIVTTTRLM